MDNISNLLKKKSCTIFLFHGVYYEHNYKIINYTNKHIHFEKFEYYLNSYLKLDLQLNHHYH